MKNADALIESLLAESAITGPTRVSEEELREVVEDIDWENESPVFKFEFDGARLYFHNDASLVSVVFIFTPESERLQGKAKALIKHIEDYARSQKKRIWWGGFCEDSEPLIKHLDKSLFHDSGYLK